MLDSPLKRMDGLSGSGRNVTDMWLPTDCSRIPFCAANEIPRSENSRVVVIAPNILIFYR